MLKIMSYNKYKQNYYIKNVVHRVHQNLIGYNGFIRVTQIEVYKGDKCQKITEEIVKTLNITSGIIVWNKVYRSLYSILAIYYKHT